MWERTDPTAKDFDTALAVLSYYRFQGPGNKNAWDATFWWASGRLETVAFGPRDERLVVTWYSEIGHRVVKIERVTDHVAQDSCVGPGSGRLH